MNIVIVGLGVAGLHYVDLLKNKKNTNLFVVDKKIVPKSKNYLNTSFEDIKKKKLHFDFAIIASPSGLHFKHAEFFLKRHSNVLIEKPFVLRIDHAKKLINLSKKNKLKCWTSLQNRYNLALIKLKKELIKKSIGKINLVDCTMLWHRDKKYYYKNWRGKYSTDGGVLTNQAIHLLDALIFNFGEVVNFDVVAGFDKKKLEAEDLILINLQHKNKTFCSFKATTRSDRNYRSAIDVIGSKGRIIIKGISLNTFNKFQNGMLYKNNKYSERFETEPGAKGGMGFGHSKLLKEFLSKNKKSSKNLEISKNIYLIKLIHSIYNYTLKRTKFNKVKSKNSILGFNEK